MKFIIKWTPTTIIDESIELIKDGDIIGKFWRIDAAQKAAHALDNNPEFEYVNIRIL